MINTIVIIFAAYLIGSISTAIITCRVMRLPDPRSEGSKNPGGTNVLRIGGKKAALITIIGDVAKGVVPVLFAKLFFEPGSVIVAWVAFAAFLGHLYPIFFRFQGGKGVATALGGLVALDLLLGGCFIATWLFVALVTRISSLSSISASIALPLFAWWLAPQYILPFVLMSGFLLWRHRTNIERLIQGKESKIGAGKKA